MAEETHVDMDAGIPANMCKEPNMKVTWANRRRMAWLSFYAFLFMTVVMLVLIYIMPEQEKKLDQMVNVYFYFVSVIAAIILGYFGTTTMPFIGRRNG